MVGRDESETVAGVHGVVGEEVELLEVHRVQSIDHLRIIKSLSNTNINNGCYCFSLNDLVENVNLIGH